MKKSYFFVLIAAVTIGCFAFTKTSHKIELSAIPQQEKNLKDSLACSDTVSFNTQILPIMINHCFSCHKDLVEYRSIVSDAKHIMKALKGDGASPMPKDAPPLNDSLIKQFQCWIDQGRLNN